MEIIGPFLCIMFGIPIAFVMSVGMLVATIRATRGLWGIL